MGDDSVGSRIKQDNSNIPHYEPLNVLSEQSTHPGPTYEQLTTSTTVDGIGHSLSDRPTYENLGYKLKANESHSIEYEGLQQRQLPASDAYESIKQKQ